MAMEGTGYPAWVACPACGGTEVRTVEQARTARGASRRNLYGRLAPGPDTGGDGCVHFVEGMVLTGIGVALAYTGVSGDKPLYTIGGTLLALVCLVGTFFVVRDDRRGKAAAEAGGGRADRLWQPAHYCYGCGSVFCPGNTPWPGALTPAQFKKLVWTEAGYADQLQPGDEARDAELPPGLLPWR